ncbi:MAG: hypothetical protein ACM3MK_14265 [Chitinophagales bacterium]
MATNFNKKHIIILIFSTVLLIYGFVFHSLNKNDDVIVTRMQASWVTDMKDDRKLVGISDNVFIGKVISQIGNESFIENIPATQFGVEVIDNIKGNLNGTVTVNQEGGEITKDGQRYLILHFNDSLLEPGKTYLFASATGDDVNWHLLVPCYGDIPINDNRSISELQASINGYNNGFNDGSEIISLKDRFTNAYQHQILFDLSAEGNDDAEIDPIDTETDGLNEITGSEDE